MPEGHVPGQKFLIAFPDGRQAWVTVPAGHRSGQVFHVAYVPAPSPSNLPRTREPVPMENVVSPTTSRESQNTTVLIRSQQSGPPPLDRTLRIPLDGVPLLTFAEAIATLEDAGNTIIILIILNYIYCIAIYCIASEFINMRKFINMRNLF